MPGRAPASAATSWLETSCSSTMPWCRRGWRRRARGFSSTRSAFGASGCGATCTPSRASTTIAASGLVFSVFTRRSTGARACIAREHRLEVRAERRAQRRRRGSRDSRAGPDRGASPGSRASARALGGGQRRRVEALAGAERVEVGALAGRLRQHDRPAGVAAAAPAERAPPAQAVEDEVAHRGAVLRAGEPARPRPARQRAFGRLAGEDGVQQLDRGGEAGTGGHRAGMCSQSPACASGGTRSARQALTPGREHPSKGIADHAPDIRA